MKTNRDSLALLEEFRTYAHQILALANRGLPRFDFLREVAKIFLDNSTCDAVELRTEGHGRWFICEGVRHPEISFKIDVRSLNAEIHGDTVSDFDVFSNLAAKLQIELNDSEITDKGSFWVSDTSQKITISQRTESTDKSFDVDLGDLYKSLAFIPFTIDDENSGLIVLKCMESHSFNDYDIEFYEGIAAILGLAVADRRTQVALRERVKELTCLYGIARLIEDPNRPLDEIMQGIVELIPPGWMYPEITFGRITLNNSSYCTQLFQEGPQRLAAPVIVNGQLCGKVEVFYAEKKRELDEGPFLKEERHLIDAIAREVSHILEHKQANKEKDKLQEQLRHADRLATIGQLAAGVAHELNEPLGNILGFAQLAQKSQDTSLQLDDDLSKIVDATLQAREIIKKLIVFARQTPSQLAKVNLNEIFAKGLYFFEARCNKAGIELVKEFEDGLPEIKADQAQLNQVLVNLVVNAIQAMPQGGKLTVRTYVSEDSLNLIVEDTGIGMSEEVRRQIFVPFFTTKDIDEGTGLGLPVVHGIVTSHLGLIKVDSEVGKGTQFIIQFPLSNRNKG
ncbi:hypothetical protein KJ564_02310 [bacterium]|nr:hypothetical protein [bacterium]MBU1882365.1 hypothetical protein [bacterium]